WILRFAPTCAFRLASQCESDVQLLGKPTWWFARHVHVVLEGDSSPSRFDPNRKSWLVRGCFPVLEYSPDIDIAPTLRELLDPIQGQVYRTPVQTARPSSGREE